MIWVEVLKLADLAAGAGREITLHGKVYALFRVEGQVMALGGLCPHQRAHLAGGVVDVGRGTVTCPRRGCLRWRFDLRTGTHADGLAVACSTHPVRVAGDAVLLGLPA